MALLRGIPVACGLGALLCACAEDGANGVGTVDLYDRPVACDVETSLCSDPRRPDVRVAPDDPRRSGVSFTSRAASQYGASGLYLYLELHRPGGTIGSLELDLPTDGGGGGRTPHAVYQEHRDGARVFSSGARAGRVELPAGEGCPCQDILLELVFTDPGPDGILGSEDDQARRLSRGVVTAGGAFCLAPRLLTIASEDTLEVGRSCAALPATPGSTSQPPSSGGSYPQSVEVGCAADPSHEDSGCDGSGSDYDYDDGSGCGGDDWGDSSGCDGGDWGDSSSGCDGGAAPSCEGDAFAATRSPRRRPPLRARLVGSALPFVLFALFTVHLRRRSRRGGRR